MTKTIKKTLALVLSIVMLMSMMPMTIPVFAYTYGNFEYSRSGSSATITKYIGTETEVVIPEKILTYNVVAIGDDSNIPFYNNSKITSVVIPDTVTSIASGAFYKCSNLKTVTIGIDITSIGTNAFNYCAALETINFKGTKAQWESITIGNGNNAILNSTVENFKINFNYGYDCEVDGHILTKVDASEATCTKDGNKAYWVCEIESCAMKFADENGNITAGDVVILGGHNLVHSEASSATCTTTGNYEYWFCDVCNTYFKDAEAVEKFENEDATVIPKNGHNTLEHVEALTANCVTQGNAEFWYCAACNTYFADAEAETTHENNNPYIEMNDNHNYRDWYSIADGKHKTYCLNQCGDEIIEDCVDSATDEDCNCDVCGKLVAHTFNDATCMAPATCIVCKETTGAADLTQHIGIKETKTENVVDGTCISAKTWDLVVYCSECETEISRTRKTGEVDLTQHIGIKETKTENIVDGTCISAKTWDMVVYCSECKTEIKRTAKTGEKDLNNHQVELEHVQANEANCTQTGNYEYWYCSDCNKYFKDAQATTEYAENEWKISATGHSPKEPVKENEVLMECDKDGSYDMVVYCATCDEELSRKTETVAHGHNIKLTFPLEYKTPATCTEPAILETWCYRCEQNVEIPVGAPLGHKETNAPNKAVTCEEDGLKGGVWCSVCEVYFVEPETITKLGHDWKEVSTTATCTEDGETTYVCENDATHTKTEDATALGHDYVGDYIIITEANCTEAGVKYRPCSREDCKIPDSQPIPAINHKNKVHHAEVPATCKDEGIIEYWFCPDCNKNYSDEACTKVATELDIDIDPNVHTAPKYYEEVSATCLESGFEEGTKCEGCGEWISGHAIIPAINHENKVHHSKVPATCIAKGVKEYWECPDCDKNYSNEACTEVATELDIDIDPNGHTAPKYYEKVSATCLEIGFEEGIKCEGCGEWISGHDIIPALNHKDENKDHTCDNNCNVYQGTHADANNDHACDYGCQVEIGTHADVATDNDHVCDYGCGAELEECVDSNKDHACDNGCAEVYGTHADVATDNDHVCDYGCAAELEDCVDSNKDHACDNGCPKDYGTHEDTDFDHDCEYGCQVEIGTHADANKDHACDYGCQVEIGTHVDANKDHACDYGCQVEIDTHADTNKDHACDYGCQVEIGTHADVATDNDHVCDYGCGAVLEDCVDNNKDHACDNGCAEVYGTHADVATDDNHVCDYGCGEVLEDCVDGDDNNHNCDVCDEEDVSAHDFTDPTCRYPATCTVCGETRGAVNSDNHVGGTYTEFENIVDGTCVSEKTWDVVTYCSGCDEELDREDKTGSKDEDNHAWSEEVTTVLNGAEKKHSRKCTRTGCDETTPIGHNFTDADYVVYTPATCKEAGVERAYCSYCRGDVYREIPKLDTHKDENKNNKCDVCDATINTAPENPTPDVPDEGGDEEVITCTCNCHKSGIIGFLYDFILFFQRLFGLNRVCTGGCGKMHY